MQKQVVKKILFIALISITILFGVSLGLLFASFQTTDVRKMIEDYELSIPTNIYDRNDELIAQLSTEQREIIPLKDIPEIVIQAFISYEDSAFFKHHGFSLKRTLAALFSDLKRSIFKRGGALQGGSTITQQLAKRLFTTQERSIFRKLKELWYSVQLEKYYSKQEILEMYLNEIYFGHGAYGIKAAAKLYFNKEVKDLNLAEAAILATLPQSPKYNSPVLYPENSKKRQKMVFKRLIENGYITKEQADKSYEEFWASYSQKTFPTDFNAQSLTINKAPYYVDAVLKMLKSEGFTDEQIFKKGLNIYTACDLKMYQASEKYLNEALGKLNDSYSKQFKPIKNAIFKEAYDIVDLFVQMTNASPAFSLSKNSTKFRFDKLDETLNFLSLFSITQKDNNIGYASENWVLNYKNSIETKILQGSVVTIDPQTGYVLVLIGGTGFTKQNQLNRALSGKFQPGSGIKPFIYAGAIEEKVCTASTVILDAPIIYKFSEEDIWEPKNYSGEYSGYVRVRTALVQSINIPMVKVMEALGVMKARKYIARFYSINESEVPPYLATALGTIGVSPLKAAKAFAVLAHQGMDVFPILIRKVDDRQGRTIRNFEKEIMDKYKTMDPAVLRIVSPQTAYIITSILTGVGKPGGTAASLSNFNFPFEFAGKTGTTQNWKDAWFNGYTQNLATVVWIGFDRSSSLGKGFTGGVIAAPIWGNIMQYFYKVLKIKIPNFTKPDGLIWVNIDANTGFLAGPDTKKVISEVFIAGTAPKQISDGKQIFSLVMPSSSFETLVPTESISSTSINPFENIQQNNNSQDDPFAIFNTLLNNSNTNSNTNSDSDNGNNDSSNKNE
ncbi:MAG: PBP1A family penicillin-binding protein [Candidatus Woesearchaeota archaeon]